MATIREKLGRGYGSISDEERAYAEQEAEQSLVDDSSFTRGVKRGYKGLKSTVSGLKGATQSFLDQKASAQSSFQDAQREQLSASTHKKETSFLGGDGTASAFESPGKFIAESLGEALPSLAESVVTGVAGAAIGSQLTPGLDPTDVASGGMGFVAGVLGKGAIKKKLADMGMRYAYKQLGHEAVKQTLKKSGRNGLAKIGLKQISQRVGQTAAITAVVGGQEAGGMWVDLYDKGIDAPGSSLLAGLFSGVSESLIGATPNMLKMFKKIGTNEALKVAKKKGIRTFAKELFKQSAKNTGEEGFQEGFQELISMVNADYNDPNHKWDEKSFANFVEAFAAGAIVGGVTGGAGGIRTQVDAYMKSKTEENRYKAKDLLNDGEVIEEDDISEFAPQVQDQVNNLVKINMGEIPEVPMEFQENLDYTPDEVPPGQIPSQGTVNGVSNSVDKIEQLNKLNRGEVMQIADHFGIDVKGKLRSKITKEIVAASDELDMDPTLRDIFEQGEQELDQITNPQVYYPDSPDFISTKDVDPETGEAFRREVDTDPEIDQIFEEGESDLDVDALERSVREEPQKRVEAALDRKRKIRNSDAAMIEADRIGTNAIETARRLVRTTQKDITDEQDIQTGEVDQIEAEGRDAGQTPVQLPTLPRGEEAQGPETMPVAEIENEIVPKSIEPFKKEGKRIDKALDKFDKTSERTGAMDDADFIQNNAGLIAEIESAISDNKAGLVIEKINILKKKMRNFATRESKKKRLPYTPPQGDGITQPLPDPQFNQSEMMDFLGAKPGKLDIPVTDQTTSDANAGLTNKEVLDILGAKEQPKYDDSFNFGANVKEDEGTKVSPSERNAASRSSAYREAWDYVKRGINPENNENYKSFINKKGNRSFQAKRDELNPLSIDQFIQEIGKGNDAAAQLVKRMQSETNDQYTILDALLEAHRDHIERETKQARSEQPEVGFYDDVSNLANSIRKELTRYENPTTKAQTLENNAIETAEYIQLRVLDQDIDPDDAINTLERALEAMSESKPSKEQEQRILDAQEAGVTDDVVDVDDQGRPIFRERASDEVEERIKRFSMLRTDSGLTTPAEKVSPIDLGAKPEPKKVSRPEAIKAKVKAKKAKDGELFPESDPYEKATNIASQIIKTFKRHARPSTKGMLAENHALNVAEDIKKQIADKSIKAPAAEKKLQQAMDDATKFAKEEKKTPQLQEETLFDITPDDELNLGDTAAETPWFEAPKKKADKVTAPATVKSDKVTEPKKVEAETKAEPKEEVTKAPVKEVTKPQTRPEKIKAKVKAEKEATANSLDPEFVRKAYAGTSTNPRTAAKAEQESFENFIEGLKKDALEYVEDNEDLQTELDFIIKEYVRERKKVLEVRRDTVSGHVAGRSKFNTKQAVRRNSALDKAEDQFSLWQSGIRAEFDKALGIDKMKSAQRQAKEQARIDARERSEQYEKEKRAKQIKYPIINDPEYGTPITKEEWKKTHSDFKSVVVDEQGKFRYRSKIINSALTPVYITDQKDVNQPSTESESNKSSKKVADITEAKPDQKTEAKEEELPVTTREGLLAFKQKMNEGKLSPEQVKEAYREFTEGKVGLEAELKKLTKKELSQYTSFLTMSDKKDRFVSSALRQFDIMFIPKSVVNTADIAGQVENITQKDLDEYAAEKKSRNEARIKEIEGMVKPKTIEDFENAKQYRKADLTDEEQSRYDELLADRRREREKTTASTGRKSVGQPIEGANFEIVKAYHEKKQQDSFVVQMTDRVDRETFSTLRSLSKEHNGYWSRFSSGRAEPGFQFTNMDDAEAFVEATKGKEVAKPKEPAKPSQTSEQRAAAKLRGLADTMKERAEATLNQDRKTNTSKRAREAASAEATAEASIAMAGTMNNIADAIESGEAKHLAKITTRTQIGTLQSILGQAKSEAARKSDKRYEEAIQEPWTDDMLNLVRYPSYSTHVNVISDIARDLDKVKGGKMLANRLRKSIVGKNGLVIIDAESGDKIIRKLGDDAAWQLVGAKEDRGRLERADIKTLPELRAALREFLAIKQDQKKADPIKDMERELIGKKFTGLDFFPTPTPIASRMVAEADIQPGMTILEPSAGKGDIAVQIKEAHPDADVKTIEVSGELRGILEAKGLEVVDNDFIEHTENYDRIVMNPPFSKGRDVEHVKHAYSLLNTGGKVVAIMSEHPFFANDKASRDFRVWLEEVGGTSEPMQEAFKGSEAFRETGVATRLVEIEKTASNAKYSINSPTSSTPITSENIEESFPGSTVTKDGDNYTVKLPSGAKFNITMTKAIPTDESTIMRGYGVTNEEAQRMSRTGALGATVPSGVSIELSDGQKLSIDEVNLLIQESRASTETVKHEGLHVARELGFFDTSYGKGIWDSLMLEYRSYDKNGNIDENKTEENIAKAREVWTGQNGLWGKIVQWFHRLKLRMGFEINPDAALNETFTEEFWSQGIDRSKGADTRFSAVDQTQTPEFKEWFGDSKVVDENGEPLVVYHGTNNKFTVFNPSTHGQAGKGIYLTAFDGDASAYGKNVMPVYAAIKNPRIINRRDIPMDAKSFRSNTENLGYDGIVINSDNNQFDEILAFNPTQIKSATDNVGTFDAANPDIRFSTDPITSIKNDVVDEARALRNAGEITQVEAETQQMWLDEAVETLKQDYSAGVRLITELKSNPRVLNDRETAILQVHYRREYNLFNKLSNELFTAQEAGNPTNTAIAQTSANNQLATLNDIEEAVRSAGREWGRAGVARQIALKKDFSLEGMERKARVANGGKALDKDQMAEIKRLADLLAKTEKELIEERSAKDALERMAAHKTLLDEEVAKESKRIKKTMSKTVVNNLGDVNNIMSGLGFSMKKKSDSGLKFKIDEDATVEPDYYTQIIPELYPAALKLAKSAGEDGITSLGSFMALIRREFGVVIEAELTFARAWNEYAEQAEDPTITIPAKPKTAKPKTATTEKTKTKKVETEPTSKIETTEADSTPDTIEDPVTTTKEEPKKSLLDTDKELTPRQITKEARNIQRELVENGITDQNEVIDAVHISLQQYIPDITRYETIDALSGYGQFSTPSKSEIDTQIRELNALHLQTSKHIILNKAISKAKEWRQEGLSDEAIAKRLVKEGLQLKATGYIRDKQTDIVRHMVAQTNEMKKELPAMPEAKEGQLQSALDAAKKAIRNRIKDLQWEISNRKRIVNKRNTLKADTALEALRKERDELIAEHRKVLPKVGRTDEQKIAAAIFSLDSSIARVKRQIKEGDIDVKKVTKISTPEIDAKRAELKALNAEKQVLRDIANPKMTPEERAIKNYEANLLRRIADYQNRIAEKDFAPRKKKAPRELTKRELMLKKRLEDTKIEFLKKAGEYELANMSPTQRAIDYLKQTAHLSRSLMTSIDLSAVFRQGGITVYAHPKLAIEAGKKMTKALLNKQEHFNSAEAIRNHTMGQFAETVGLSITSDDGRITRQEEAYMGRWSEKIPGIAASGRAYTTFLNNMRFNLFVSMVENIGKNGKVTVEEGKIIARYINTATGRADFKALNNAAANLNTVFFAPRYVASRFQYLTMPFMLPFMKTTPRVKKMIAQEYARTFGGAAVFIGSLMALGALTAGTDEEEPTFEMDPRSTDFMKIKIGETRIDPMAGLSQVIVFSSKVVSGSTKSPITGKVKSLSDVNGPFGQNRWTVTGRFLRTKLGPIPGATVTMLNDMTDVVGKKHSLAGLASGLFIPLSIREVADTMVARGYTRGSVISMMALFGMGVGTYGKRTEYLAADKAERIVMFEKDIKRASKEDGPLPYSDMLSREKLLRYKRALNRKKKTKK